MKNILTKLNYMIFCLFCSLTLGVLQSCTQTPEQMAEKALHSSTVRLTMKDNNDEHLGSGSGVFVTRDEIVTHISVIAGATSVEAKLVNKGKKYTIEGVTGFDVDNDLVILKVTGKGAKSLELGNSKEVPEGASVHVLGYPGGENGRVTPRSIVMNLETLLLLITTSLPDEDSVQKFVQMGEMIPEDSGAPVLYNGRVVGLAVSTSLRNYQRDYQYAIPSNAIEALLKQKSKHAEPLTQWQEKTPIRPLAASQLAKRKGREATINLFKEDDTGKKVSTGSGFFVHHNQIATNIHVIAGATKVFAKLVHTDAWYTIEGVTAFDVKNDLAILQTIEQNEKYLPLANSNSIQIGDPIAAIGSPTPLLSLLHGLEDQEEGKITEGTVHSIRESDEFLRLKVELSPGNSGGPVLNSKGEVIGIATGASRDFSYAISSNALEALLKQKSEQVEPWTLWQDKKPIRAYALWAQGNALVPFMDILNAYKEVNEALNSAIELYPEFTLVYRVRGEVNLKIDQYQKAITDFDEVIQRVPDHALAYYYRGRAKYLWGQHEKSLGTTWQQGQYRAAVKDFDKTIELISDYASAYIDRSHAKEALGKSEEAENDRKIVKQLHMKKYMELRRRFGIKN